MTITPEQFRAFRFRGKGYIHVENGWCARQVDASDKSRQVWRLYWGKLRPGTEYPGYVYAYEDFDEQFVEFEEFSEAVEWVLDRRFTH